MASRFEGGRGRTLPPPPPCRLRRGPVLPVLVEDPGLDALARLGVAIDRAEVVEVLPVRSDSQGARREGDEDLALGTPPQREADQTRVGELAFLEVDLRLAHEALGTALALHELHPHRSPPRDSM